MPIETVEQLNEWGLRMMRTFSDAFQKNVPQPGAIEMAEKKNGTTRRIYPITDADGNQRNIEATGLAAAIIYVYEPKCGEPLSGPEVRALYDAGGKVEVVPAKAAK